MSDRNFRSILTGSFSTPCAGNPTVAMMEAGYKEAGVDARYINCDVKPENLQAAVNGARAMEWIGFNCSIPHKVNIIQYLDGLAESAKIIGAVNCIQNKDGKLIGNNTDGKGFLASLKAVVDPKGKKICMFGAGGAARAIAVELGLAGASHITIYNIDVKMAEVVAGLVNDNTKCKAEPKLWKGEGAVPEGVDIVINATSVGFGDATAIPAIQLSTLKSDHIVADVVPNPPNTRFLQEASKKGCTTLPGLGMLVNQGRIGYNLWTGNHLDADVMKKTLSDIFDA